MHLHSLHFVFFSWIKYYFSLYHFHYWGLKEKSKNLVSSHSREPSLVFFFIFYIYIYKTQLYINQLTCIFTQSAYWRRGVWLPHSQLLLLSIFLDKNSLYGNNKQETFQMCAPASPQNFPVLSALYCAHSTVSFHIKVVKKLRACIVHSCVVS